MFTPRQPLSSGEIIITTIATFILYLLCVRYCTKSFTYIVDFEPHNKPVKLILLLSPFYRNRGTERSSNFPKTTQCVAELGIEFMFLGIYYATLNYKGL